MKKVLVIGSTNSGTKNNPEILANAIGARVATWEELVFTIATSRVDVTTKSGEHIFDGIDLVICVGWYKSGKNSVYRDVAFALSRYLEAHDIEYWNQEMGDQRSTTKLSCLVQLALKNIPVTTSVFSLDNHYLRQAELPFVAKAVASSRGRSNYLIQTESERQEVIESKSSPLLIQSFLPNDHDLRVICFDSQPQMVLRRAREADAKTHLNNVSQGGEGTWIDLASLSPELLTTSQEICKIMNRNLAGIDFIPDSTSSFGYSCLEVNAIPQLTSGYDVEAKLATLKKVIEE